MAGSLARPGFGASSCGQVPAVWPLPEGHSQQTFGHDCSPALFADEGAEAAEEQRYMEGQNGGHSDRQVNGDVNDDGGGASRGAGCVGDNNAGPVGTFREPALLHARPIRMPRPKAFCAKSRLDGTVSSASFCRTRHVIPRLAFVRGSAVPGQRLPIPAV
ncbi:hypothetical protein MTO96_025221 [Rhipicephalus appendiculatus]